MENILEMIQAKELRTGNWVAFTGGKKPRYCKVLEIRKDYLIVEDLGLSLQLHIDSTSTPPQPIPLTPEILEKAGFVKVNNSLNHDTPMYMNGRSGISLTYYKNCFNFEWKDYNSVQIHFVHQLQNLFRVLTGEELNIEL